MAARIYQFYGVSFNTTVNYRNVLGSRKETAVSKDNELGSYDDAIWVFWLDKKNVKHSVKYRANTEPCYKYEKRGTDGQDADGDKKNDLGRLPLGVYTYKSAMEFSDRLKRDVFKMKKEYRVERDINHDGFFNAEDVKLIAKDREHLMMVDDMHIHQGGENSTWSAGCQTLPPVNWQSFVKDIGEGRKAGQSVFTYVLTSTA